MATDTNNQVVETETRATDVNATDTNNQVVETETRATDTSAEAVETETRATDTSDEAPGLCVRCYGDGTKSFIFVYRIGDRQRFLRIGKTPLWSLEVARTRAKELRSIVENASNRRKCDRSK